MNGQSLLVLFTMASLAGQVLFGDERANESQGAISQPTLGNPSARDRGVSPRDSTNTGGSEVFLNFAIGGKSCAQFDSSLDLMGVDSVAIALLANTDIRQTRVIPFFGVQDAPYMVASGILQGNSFYSFTDAGSGIVPVAGNRLSVKVCNDSADQRRYIQLTLYVSHR